MNERTNYTLSNKYMFSAVMRNPRICKAVLERILNIEIEKIDYLEDSNDKDDVDVTDEREAVNIPEYEKTIDPKRISSKGIRIDIYLKNSDSVYTVEMQNGNEKDLPKRSRYYQALMDIDQLEKSAHYSDLKQSYVIFICRFDPYDQGRHLYSFESMCDQDPSLKHGDMVHYITLNTKGTMNDVPKPLKAFLDYIENGGFEESDMLLKEIDDTVKTINKDKAWRMDTMTIEQELRDMERWTAEKTAKETAEKYEARLDEAESRVQEAESKAHAANNQIHVMITNMKKSGMSKEDILKISGLSESEYEDILKTI